MYPYVQATVEREHPGLDRGLGIVREWRVLTYHNVTLASQVDERPSVRDHRAVPRDEAEHTVRRRQVAAGHRKARAGIIAEFTVVRRHIVETIGVRSVLLILKDVIVYRYARRSVSRHGDVQSAFLRADNITVLIYRKARVFPKLVTLGQKKAHKRLRRPVRSARRINLFIKIV